MLKTYKIYEGKILLKSEAIENLYKVAYEIEGKQEIDWLYGSKPYEVNQSVFVYDGQAKYIMRGA